MRRFFSVLLVIVLSACATPPPPRADFPTAELDRLLEQARQDLHVPGLAFVVVRDDCVVYARAFGERDIAAHAPVTLDTLFPIGSATKPFTSMAAALSQEAGLLSLGDHPQTYLPYFHMADADADARVTLRDMLSHRTGLMAKADLAAVPAVLTRAEYVRAAVGAAPTAPFGARFQYSNAMVTAVGEAVGAANHASWENVIERRIFAPLGMRESVANVRDMARFPDHVTGYVYDAASGAWRATPPTHSLEAMAPAGAIASSANDMARWLLMLTNGGVFEGRRFVSEASFRDLITPRMQVSEDISYALAWAVYQWNGETVVEHNGGGEGISALVSFIPARHVGFVLLSNTSPHDLTAISHAGRRIYPLIFGVAAPTPVAPTAPVQEEAFAASAPISVDALVARMLRASGGARVLARHHSLEIEADKSYDNQGVSAALVVRARAPAAREERETWRAVDREIARLRVFFDGARGAQETTFGQDAVNDGPANARARRDDALHPLLDLAALYADRRVVAAGPIDGEPVYALELGNDGAVETTLFVSQASGRILRRSADTGVTDYADYRSVDGELLPFRSTIHDALGQTTIIVRAARFNGAIPAAAFAPAR